jgi:hypothetical protein
MLMRNIDGKDMLYVWRWDIVMRFFPMLNMASRNHMQLSKDEEILVAVRRERNPVLSRAVCPQDGGRGPGVGTPAGRVVTTPTPSPHLATAAANTPAESTVAFGQAKIVLAPTDLRRHHGGLNLAHPRHRLHHHQVRRLCAGLDTLVAKVPALKETTPALYSTTKEAAISYATLITTYMATFTLVQLVLKASDLGLETADSLLKLLNCENCALVVEALHWRG